MAHSSSGGLGGTISACSGLNAGGSPTSYGNGTRSITPEQQLGIDIGFGIGLGLPALLVVLGFCYWCYAHTHPKERKMTRADPQVATEI